MPKASLKSIASYVPEQILSNYDLEKIIDTTDEWITRRTGIKERRIASKDESTSDLGTKAAIKAIERANLKPQDIDAILVATLSPDYFTMPSTACKIAANLGLNGITAFDISAACSGFIYLLEQAKALAESGLKKNVLIIGAEKASSIMDYTDRSICILFGDGAGAGVVSLDENNPIIDVHTASNGNYGDLLMTERSQESKEASSLAMRMKGNEVFKIAVQTLSNDVVEILSKNQILPEQIDLFIPHQANLRIIKAVQERLNLSDEKCVVTVQKYGNTSAASIPMAMNDAYEEGRLKKGNLILLDAFGGGFTWGSALLKFGGENFS
ncbi:ketoacyl-ACP synthase III [Campylobacter coli]|uniref:Beta-ketoacyl-[acyl-carrier-protein] synthase III n=1 Tax=Campylobacter jejuni TaxID=197 RepID=A0A6F9MYA4_CAMJU|nr:ketoacyl-ACP synthase III [Campylobacter coli]EAL0080116.1 ketoacyl-ACP synthase III [Campylobacter lari]EGP7860281.1 ketoacyl-ACP synthase III [Campylobacter jejuni]EAI7223774.1 ketoacyl-ACP synthase III [Campylobacter coli]EAI8832180.1 ketoacyl-ACP synthase III [Campylobacter coli]